MSWPTALLVCLGTGMRMENVTCTHVITCTRNVQLLRLSFRALHVFVPCCTQCCQGKARGRDLVLGMGSYC